MNDHARDKLREIVTNPEFDRDRLCTDAGYCRALLNDFCTDQYRAEAEKKILVAAVEEGIAEKLRDSSENYPGEMLLRNLAERLVNKRFLDRTAAQWAVNSWAMALNIPTTVTISSPVPSPPPPGPTPPPVTTPPPVITPPPVPLPTPRRPMRIAPAIGIAGVLCTAATLFLSSNRMWIGLAAVVLGITSLRLAGPVKLISWLAILGGTAVIGASVFLNRELDPGKLVELKTLSGHAGPVLAVAFSPDGKTLATASEDAKIMLWDARGGTLKNTLVGHDGPVRSVAFSPNGAILASGSDDFKVIMWDVSSGTQHGPQLRHPYNVSAVAFSSNGKLLATGTKDKDNRIRIWEAQSGELKATWNSPDASIDSISFSPVDKVLASGSDDFKVRLWNIERGESNAEPLRGARAAVISLAFSKNGRLLAGAGQENAVRVWNVDSQELQTFTAPDPGPLLSVAFSPSGKLLVTGGTAARIWAVNTSTIEATVSGPVRAVGWSPDGRLIATSLKSNVVLHGNQ